MERSAIKDHIASWMHELCVEIHHRHVGSPGNEKASTFFEQAIRSFGMDAQRQEFDCLDWESGPVLFEVEGRRFPVQVSPFSLPCDSRAEIVSVSDLEELERKDVAGRLLLLHGEIAKEQLMPKNFPFYNPDNHRRIIRALEMGKPAGIVAATGKNPELAGSLYPFPLFEDGDFDIPSVYLKDVEGERVLDHVGDTAILRFESWRIPSKGCNALTRIQGSSSKKIVVCAHIDTKKDTPGALDNGSGVAVLLALAELLKDEAPGFTVEIVALNGEDYYSAPGQVVYLDANREAMDRIFLAMNLDGAGHRGVRTAVSLYDTPDSVRAEVRDIIQSDGAFVEGEPWYQGDHSIFVQRGRPAIAITSEDFEWLSREVTHTPKDDITQVDFDMLAGIALVLRQCILRLGG